MATGLDEWTQEQQEQRAAQQAQQEAEQRDDWSSTYGQWGIPYIDPNDDKYASKLQAALTRAEWENWKQQFQPVYEQLVGTIGDEEMQRREVQRAGGVVERSFQATRADMDRRQAQYGGEQDETTREAMDTTFGLSKAASTAAARNRTRQNIENREMALMVGGLSGIGQLREEDQ